MISFLTGKCFFIDGNTIWILTSGGVAYEALASKNLLQNCRINEPVSAFIVSVFKQDDMKLFAFDSTKERSSFLLLTSVQGVGSKVALSILSNICIDNILTALIKEDVTAITQAEGVGPKLAKRIINELKDKSFAFAHSIADTANNTIELLPIKNVPTPESRETLDSYTQIKDSVTALINLGYQQTTAHNTVIKAAKELKTTDEPTTTENLVKGSLQLLKQ